MDNNNGTQRRRRRVSKKVYRRRQLAALCVIALLVLIVFILIAKGCSKDNKKSDSGKSSVTTTTTTTTLVTVPVIVTEPTTTTLPVPSESGGFKLDKYSIYLEVGGTDMPFVQEYPEGSSEADELWSSENSGIATVDNYGHITAVAPGETYIILKSAADQTKSVQVKVKVADSGNTSAGGTENFGDTAVTTAPDTAADTTVTAAGNATF